MLERGFCFVFCCKFKKCADGNDAHTFFFIVLKVNIAEAIFALFENLKKIRHNPYCVKSLEISSLY